MDAGQPAWRPRLDQCALLRPAGRKSVCFHALHLKQLTRSTTMPKTMKGPGIFLAQFAGDAAPFNSLPAITRWAASLGTEVCSPDLGRAAVRSGQGGVMEHPATRSRASARMQASKSPNCPPICRDSLSPSIRPMTANSTLSRRLPSVATRRPARLGRSIRSSRPPRRRVISGFPPRSALPARWPSPISIPGRSAPGRADRGSLCRAWPPLEADPRHL